MKQFLFAAAAILSTTVFADVKLDDRDLTVISVKITTPLPTGLESVSASDKSNELFAAIRKHPNVAPFMRATEALYKDKMKDAEKYGANAHVVIDCAKHPAPYGTENKDFCAVTATKNYGWYADLDLKLEVTGFIHKSKAK